MNNMCQSLKVNVITKIMLQLLNINIDVSFMHHFVFCLPFYTNRKKKSSLCQRNLFCFYLFVTFLSLDLTFYPDIFENYSDAHGLYCKCWH